jgi:hypothetical protein
MATKNNVIDMMSRRLKQMGNAEVQSPQPTATAPIVDMTERRNEILQQERRQVRRTILSEFLSACVVLPKRGLLKVMVYDISENGIAFDTAGEVGQFKAGEELAMRVYLSNETYFPFVATIANVRALVDEGTFRHGANFEKGTVNDQALFHFVKFIETVSASLQRDTGDVMVSGLGKR